MSISAMKQALEAIKETDQRITPGGLNSDTRTKLQEAITALRQAIAEAEKQEPVAFVSGYTNGECVVMPMNPAVVFSVGTALYNAPVHATNINKERVHETAKREHEFEEMVKRGTKAWADTPDDWGDELRGGVEKREWVGLTDEERHELNNFRGLMPFIHAIEAKLKEKNT